MVPSVASPRVAARLQGRHAVLGAAAPNGGAGGRVIAVGKADEQTAMFRIKAEEPCSAREVLRRVYDALAEKGHNPVDQLVGYLLSGDPAYITSHKEARNLIRRLERDELLGELVRYYMKGDGMKGD